MQHYVFADGIAVVTGAASGIGEALSHTLARRGSHLVLLDRDAARLEAVAGAIRSAYPVTVETHVVDLAHEAATTATADAVRRAHPRIRLLVNNAGVALAGRFDQVTLEEFGRVIDINFHATVRLTHLLLPALKAEPGSHLANVSSLFGLIAPAGQAAYSASKFAVRGFTEALRHELADDGIGVTSIHPGGIRTRIAESAVVGSGVDPVEYEAGRQQFAKLLTIPPAAAAAAIVTGIERRQGRVLIGWSARIPDLLARLLPGSYGRLIAATSARRVPPGPSSPAGALPEVSAETTVDGRKVRYRVDGDGSPVVLLHGITRSLDDWAEQHERLADRHRVYSVDLPGYGESAPLDGPYTMPMLARFVERFLDAVGVEEPAHVVGNSLGGAIAMQLAVHAPERVRSLVLVNSAGFGREVTVALRILAIRPLARLLLSRPSREAARRVERSLYYDRQFVTEARIARTLALSRRPHGAEVLLKTARSLGTVRGVRPQWRETLLRDVAPLAIPTLVVWGDHDLILPAVHLDAARVGLPHAQTHLFTDTGHMPQIERADEFSRLVSAFWVSAAHAAPAAPSPDPTPAAASRRSP